MRFKHLYIILPLLVVSAKSLAQSNQPNLGQAGPSGTNNITWTTPAEVSTTGDISYVRSFVPLVPITDTADVNTSSQPGNIRQQTAYLDGFMQPFQTVTRNAVNVNGQTKHLIGVAFNYPSQESRSFLPYSSGTSGVQSNAFQAQRDFYDNLYPNEGYTSFSRGVNTSTSTQYSGTTYLPGKSQSGQGRGTMVQSVSNAANEVIIWDLDSYGVPVASGYYAAFQLIGQQAVAPIESGSASTAPQSRTYTDKDGKLILKMVAFSNASGSTYYESTYYVYDEKGNLRCTITPKAFKYYMDNGTMTGSVTNNLCFQYRYDDKGRLSAAQKPGEDDFTYVVYDAKDRVVMRQTPNERFDKKWEITYYDGQGRIKATSIFEDRDNQWNQEQWQSELDAAAVNGASPNTIPYYLATSTGEASYPDDNINDNDMMSYSYYDDYSLIDPNGNEWNNLNTQLSFSETISIPGAESPERSDNVHGMVTGSMVRILPAPDADPLKTGEWRKNIIFYDHKGRVNFSGTSDSAQGNIVHFNISGTQYDFANRALINKHAWYNANSTDAIQGHSELTKYSYDAISGALLNTKHSVDGGAWNTINTFTYDELGHVKRKSYGGGGEVQDMGYNIRGQLTGINGTYAETGLKENYSRSFGESIKYDYGFTKNRFDGKMAGMIWRGSDAYKMLAYGYEYTQHQLLKTADFNYQSSIYWVKTNMDYSVSNLQYDENGNLTSMNQRGTEPGVGPVDMDILDYTYRNNSNRLDQVGDQSTAGDYGAGDFQDNNSNGSSDYYYDANGNVVKDVNKGINTEISYTHFNKPINIVLDNGNTFSYSYDATGGKAQEILVDQQQGTVVTDYIGSAVYENDALKYILTAEGRTVYDASAASPFKEEFFIKDHLGNVRSTIDVNSYMPKTYLAEYEIASANLENLVFDNIDELRENKPGDGSTMAARLNGSISSTSVGSALLLHVMAGDKLDMKVNDYYDYYDNNLDTPVNAEDMIGNVITTLTGGYNGFIGENHNTTLVNDAFSSNNAGAYNLMLETTTDPNKPKAYLNYVMFDEHMNIVQEASGAFQAQHEGNWGEIGTIEAMEMPANGYIAIYLSNASLRDVYFDRMQVKLVKGNLLEETHYYPHGLPILGLSAQDNLLTQQRRKYQGNEYIRSGLNWMSFGARQYDPQIGRFLSVDPLAAFAGQDRYSPYAAMGNQPESMIDPNGLTPLTLEKAQAYGGQSAGGWATDLGFTFDDNTRWGGDVGGVAYIGPGGGANGNSIEITNKAAFAQILNMLGSGASIDDIMNGDGNVSVDGKNKGEVEVKGVAGTNDGDGIGVEVMFGTKSPITKFWSNVKKGWNSVKKGWNSIKKGYNKALRSVYDAFDRAETWIDNFMGYEASNIRDKTYNKNGGGIEFTGNDGHNEEGRRVGHADDKKESLDKFMELYGDRGGSGGWGNFSEWYESYDNFMHAANLLRAASEGEDNGAPQKNPKPYLYGKVGESINIDTNGRNIPSEQFNKEYNHLKDSLWGPGYH